MKKLSLIQRFSVTALLVMVISAFLFGSLVTSIMEKHLINYSVSDSKKLTEQNVLANFSPDELQVPVTPLDYERLTEKIRGVSFGSDIIDVKVWNRNMFLVWSGKKDITGRKYSGNKELVNAFSGIGYHAIKDAEEIGEKYDYLPGNGSIMELYVPIRFKEYGDILFVFEVYKSVHALHNALAGHKRTIWLLTALSFSMAYCALWGVVWNASRRIELQTKEITRSKQNWEDTFDSIADMITIHDRDYNIIRANRSARRILKLPDSFLNEPSKCFQYYHGTNNPPEGCPSCNCFSTKESATFEIFEPHLDSYVEIRSIPRIGVDNELKGLIHIARDITERKKIEEDIKMARFEWERTFDQSSELIVLVNEDFNIIRCNRSFADFAGIMEDALMGRKCTDIIPLNVDNLMPGQAFAKMEVKTCRAEWLYVSYCPIHDEKGKFLNAVVSCTDITSLKTTEEQLVRSEEELSKRVDDLENFYDMAVGRELRMKGLKKQIMRLEKELELKSGKNNGEMQNSA